MIIKKIFSVVFLICLFVSCSSSNLDFKVLDVDAGSISEKTTSDIRYWTFDANQQQLIKQFYENSKDGSLYVEFQVKSKTVSSDVELGFLYSSDIAEKIDLISILRRPIVRFSASDFAGQEIGVFFSFNKEQSLPCGFWVKQGESDIKVLEASVQRAAIGFDYSSEKQLYAFAHNGGKIKRNERKMDLSAASFCFDSINSSYTILPQMLIKFQNEVPKNMVLKIAAATEKIQINPSDQGVTIPLSALKNPFVQFDFIGNPQIVKSAVVFASDKNLLQNAVMYSNNPLVAYPVDPGLIIKWPKKNWRASDYEIFVWDRFPHILIMDTSFYSYQDKMFKRLAFYVEKQGYKGKLWGDDVIGNKHGYNAHDYQAKDLAKFFNEAARTNFPLNQEELLLKKILIQNGILLDNGNNFVSEGKGAILSISQSTPISVRKQLLAHECWHGIFFEDEEFRNTVASIYYTMDQDSLNFMKEYFRLAPGLGYDLNDDYLMKTEFMSYLLQFDLNSVQKRWLYYANRPYIRQHATTLSDYLIKTNAEGLLSANQMMDEYVSQRWNLSAGRVWLATTLNEND